MFSARFNLKKNRLNSFKVLKPALNGYKYKMNNIVMIIALHIKRIGKLEENNEHPIRPTCNLYFN